MEREAIAAEGARHSTELGKAFSPSVEGQRLSGIYRQSVVLPAGRFAILEKSKEFTLVRWREALEARRGLEMSGIEHRDGITRDLGTTAADQRFRRVRERLSA